MRIDVLLISLQIHTLTGSHNRNGLEFPWRLFTLILRLLEDASLELRSKSEATQGNWAM